MAKEALLQCPHPLIRDCSYSECTKKSNLHHMPSDTPSDVPRDTLFFLYSTLLNL